MGVYIIAEAGVNHNGEESFAFELINVAKQAGADAIKFQTFVPELIATKNAPKADYQKSTTDKIEAQLKMLENLCLSNKVFFALKARCSQLKIDFLSTPFDLISLGFLHQELEMRTLKIASGEITNGPLLLAAAQTCSDIILSTGMSTLEDVQGALAVLAFGYTNIPAKKPNSNLLDQAYNSAAGKTALNEKVTLLHCTTEYPASYDEVNLSAMDTLRDTFNLPVGYSDHTTGTLMSMLATARGATIIEKHFTLDKNMAGPDHAASLEPPELVKLVEDIRQVERSLGYKDKKPGANEEKNLPVVRKSLVAARYVGRGEIFTEENLVAKRPGTGLSPMKIWNILGLKANRNFQKDEIIEI
jgi:N-acetylneuraminate synthase